MFGRFRGPTAFSLNPFALWPEAASRVAGLGGTGTPPDPQAVFHTTYTTFEPGPMVVDVTFGELEATRGTLHIYAMALPDQGDPAKIQHRAVVALDDLAAAGGRHRLAVMIKKDHTYAFMGRVIDDTDARAASLSVQTDRRADGEIYARKLAAAKSTLFRSTEDRTGLVIDRPATLADPTSQMCTAAQFDEPDYARWLDIFHRPVHRHRKQWEYVWICRTLEAMGMLRQGGRGIGFGCGVEPLPAAFASFGISVTATDLHGDDGRAEQWRATDQHLLSVDALADANICPPEQFRALVEVDAIDMTAIPAERVGYDFCWSSCSLEHLGSIEAGLSFIERSLDTLRPGGVAVHTTEFNLTSDTRTIKRGGTVLFRRRDVEAFARKMIAAGHQVLPITFDQGDQPEDQYVDVPPYASDIHFKLLLGQYVSTSFGLAIRKAA